MDESRLDNSPMSVSSFPLPTRESVHLLAQVSSRNHLESGGRDPNLYDVHQRAPTWMFSQPSKIVKPRGHTLGNQGSLAL